MVCALTLDGAVAPESVAWGRTAEAFAGRRVLVRLSKGVRIEGDWAGVTADTFTMNVRKTSDRRAVGKGLRTLPRSSILGVRTGTARVRGRVIGVAAGYFGVGGVGVAIYGRNGGEFAAPIAAIAGGIAGYFVGRAMDRATHEVVLGP